MVNDRYAIRYALDDAFVATAGPGHLRAKVCGRSDEPFPYGPVALHPHTVRAVLVRAPEVLEYQVRQTERGIDVAVVASGPVPALAARLDAALADAGLPHPRAQVRVVPRIERDPTTGKLRLFVPLSG